MDRLNKVRIIDVKGEEIGFIKINKARNHFLKSQKDRKNNPVLIYKDVKPMLKYLGYSQIEVAEVLDVNASTLSRWEKADTPIGILRSKTISDIDHIIAKGVRIFGTEEAFKEWLNTKNYALGDIKPIEMLKDPYQIELIDSIIEALSWGNFV